MIDAAEQAEERARRRAEERERAPQPPSPDDDTPHAADRAPSRTGEQPRLTDIGNAQRFARMHGHRFRYVHAWERWLAWDGRRWKRDELGSEMVAAKHVIGSLFSEAEPLIRAAAAAMAKLETERDPRERKAAEAGQFAAALLEHARKSSAAGRVEAMIKLARSEEPIAAAPGDFDRDPFALNVLNGTLDLREGKLRPHRQTDMLTRLAPVAFDPEARAPRWEAFLARVLPDRELRAWLQRFAGYALTGNVSEQILAFPYGAGANGKNVFLDTLSGVMGDYAIEAEPDLLLAKQNASHPTGIADLDGARLAICSEIDEGRAWNEALIKRITGNRTLKARRVFENNYEFTATHKLIVAANSKPRIRGTDHGIRRRMRLIPFNVTIPPAERIRDLDQLILAEESAGVLAWAVRGCLAWQAEGLGKAQAIDDATKQYLDDQDVLGNWIEEECTLANPEAFTPTTRLHIRFSAWCVRTGRHPWSRETMREALARRDRIIEDRKSAARGFKGIGLLAQWTDEDERAAQAQRPPSSRGDWAERRTGERGEA